MILETDWGSTLSRMSSTLNYFNWLHLVFIFKNSKVFVERWYFSDPPAVSEHTHRCQQPPQWQKSSYRADEAGRVLLVCRVGFEPATLYMLDILTLPLSCSSARLIMLSRLLWSSCPSFLSVWDCGCVLSHTQSGLFNICHLWGRVLHTV